MRRSSLFQVALLTALAIGPTVSAQQSPQDSDRQPVRLARAAWDTGWFQAAVAADLLAELGYTVDGPHTLENHDFYRQVADGEVDLWVNGWFPPHWPYFEELLEPDAVVPVGFIIPSPAPQGYLIDKPTAERLGIKELSDLADPTIAAAFDLDGNGRADLVGCDRGWGCAQVIDHHLEAYGLDATVDHLQGDYTALMFETIERFRRGEPVFFYTWTPNWTVAALEPGRDVVWLEVPFSSLPDGQKHLEDHVAVASIDGCEHDPCNLGWPATTVRAVANRGFLAANPGVRKLLGRLEIPIEDIQDQNLRMFLGGGQESQIQRHAEEWISANRGAVDDWLDNARGSQPVRETHPPETIPDRGPNLGTLRVVTKRLEPFVFLNDGRFSGFSIDLWKAISDELNLEYEIYAVNSVAKLLDDVSRGVADVGISGIDITARREQSLDFSHSMFESGLQIMVAQNRAPRFDRTLRGIVDAVRSKKLLIVLAILAAALVLSAHIIWLFERRHNPEFGRAYFLGIWNSLWWAVVTVSTVGYGDKTPRGAAGRAFALLWIFVGYVLLAIFTATITTTATVNELHGALHGPADLPGMRVATVRGSTSADYLRRIRADVTEVGSIDDAVELLRSGRTDAIVYDAPVLQFIAEHSEKSLTKVIGPVFNTQSYGIVLPPDSSLREAVNRALLELKERGTYREIRELWFGR